MVRKIILFDFLLDIFEVILVNSLLLVQLDDEN